MGQAMDKFKKREPTLVQVDKLAEDIKPIIAEPIVEKSSVMHQSRNMQFSISFKDSERRNSTTDNLLYLIGIPICALMAKRIIPGNGMRSISDDVVIPVATSVIFLTKTNKDLQVVNLYFNS